MRKMRKKKYREKIYSIFIVLALSMVWCFMCMPIDASAEEITGNGYTFDTETGILTVTTNAGTTAWRYKAPFSSDKSIVKEIIIEDSVTIIGDSAFSGCTGLTLVIIPNSVTEIRAMAFGNCTNLTKVYGPYAATYQGSSFSGKPFIKYEIDADNNVIIKGIAFASANRGIQIPNTIDGIGTVVSADSTIWVYISTTGHNHIGGTVTCTEKARCAICGTSYGEFGEHSMVNGICSVCGCSAGIAIDETSFPDAAFREYISGLEFDKNGDGYLSDEEIEAVKTISVANKNISNLKGVELFTELTTLRCESNRLTTLDVSSNTKLTKLYCYYNQLGTLDVSNNTKLTTLHCYSNKLSTLDVSGNTALTTLYCHSNQLSTLDVSNSIMLTTIYCQNNRLASLDVSSNIALTTLYCQKNQLTSLDVSNTALSNFDCSNNEYAVSTCLLDPAALSEGFALSKASGWTNAELTDDNKILYLGGDGTAAVTYTYDCGNGNTATFILRFPKHSCTKVEATDATCTEDGNIEYYECEDCGYKFAKSMPTAETDILKDEDIVIDATKHNYGNWLVTTKPTLTTTGEAERVCENDSTHKETKELPALNDTHVWTKDDSQHIEPTEEQTGKDVYTSEYGEVEVTLPKKEHIHFLVMHEAVTATCTTDGNEAYWVCSNCHKMFSDEAGETEIAEIPTIPSGHNYSEEWKSDATGHWKECSLCGQIEQKQPHDYDDITNRCKVCDYTKVVEPDHTHDGILVPAIESTCITSGNKAYYTCSCGKWFSDSGCTTEVTAHDVVIPALGHDYGENYHSDADGHWKVCSRCGTAGTKLSHKYDGDRDADCNDCGYKRVISDVVQPTPQPTPQPIPQPTPQPTPQPPSSINPPQQSQPIHTSDNQSEGKKEPEDKEEAESTETPKQTEQSSETEKEKLSEEDGKQTISVSVDNGKLTISGDSVTTGNVEGMSAPVTTLKLGNGAVIVTVVCAEQEYTAGVTDTVAVANTVLTPEQLELVKNGETIEIRIDVKDISDKVPEQDREVIEKGIEEYQKEVPGLTLGMYVDISMFIKIGEGDWNAITETGEPIDVIIGIPEKLQEKGRTYYIIRAHDGVHTVMTDMDDAPSTITISTGRFSSYAIAYVEAEGADDGAKCGLCHICPTFLGICCFVWLAIIIVAAIIAFILLRRKKEKNTLS